MKLITAAAVLVCFVAYRCEASYSGRGDPWSKNRFPLRAGDENAQEQSPPHDAGNTPEQPSSSILRAGAKDPPISQFPNTRRNPAPQYGGKDPWTASRFKNPIYVDDQDDDSANPESPLQNPSHGVPNPIPAQQQYAPYAGGNSQGFYSASNPLPVPPSNVGGNHPAPPPQFLSHEVPDPISAQQQYTPNRFSQLDLSGLANRRPPPSNVPQSLPRSAAGGNMPLPPPPQPPSALHNPIPFPQQAQYPGIMAAQVPSTPSISTGGINQASRTPQSTLFDTPEPPRDVTRSHGYLVNRGSPLSSQVPPTGKYPNNRSDSK